MITKEKLKQHIDNFPNELSIDELSIDELIDRLVFIDKLEKRIVESDRAEAF